MKGLRRLLLYLLHEENRIIKRKELILNENHQSPFDKPVDCLPLEYDHRDKGTSTFNEGLIDSSVINKSNENIFDLHSSRLGHVDLLDTANEKFFSIISSFKTLRRPYWKVMEDVGRVIQTIRDLCSTMPGHHMDIICSDSLALPYLLPLLVSEMSALRCVHSYLPNFGYPFTIITQSPVENVTNFSDYPILNKGSLFKAAPIHFMSCDIKNSKESCSIYGKLIEEPIAIGSRYYPRKHEMSVKIFQKEPQFEEPSKVIEDIGISNDGKKLGNNFVLKYAFVNVISINHCFRIF